jgi:hypothetical protein
MKRPFNPLELELLMQAIYMAHGAKVNASAEHVAAADRLVQAGCVRWAMTGHVAATERGQFYIKHLLSIPYPVDKVQFVIPEAST